MLTEQRNITPEFPVCVKSANRLVLFVSRETFRMVEKFDPDVIEFKTRGDSLIIICRLVAGSPCRHGGKTLELVLHMNQIDSKWFNLTNDFYLAEKERVVPEGQGVDLRAFKVLRIDAAPCRG